MKRFRFSLQKVLDFRQKQEEQLKVRWAETVREAVAARRQWELRRQLLEETQRQWDTLSQDPAGEMALWESHHRYVQWMRHRCEEAHQTWQEAEANAQQARAALVEAARARRSLELLREQQLLRYRREVERQEMAWLDEVSTVRYWRMSHSSE